jgi:hypothetical protein
LGTAESVRLSLCYSDGMMWLWYTLGIVALIALIVVFIKIRQSQ